MSLSSAQLDAFVAVARELNFSNAAKASFVTQSALSQRIKALEEELGLSVFIRKPSGVVLTEIGEKLLRYCQTKDRLEDEFMSLLKSDSASELAGVLRIAGYSSVMRSIIIPTFAPLLRNNPKIKIEFKIAEMSELPGMLNRSEADFIIMDCDLERRDVEKLHIGAEKYIVIEGKDFKGPSDVYLDHNQNDRATEIFFNSQKGRRPTYRRAYMGDVYGILDGVALGFGRAVMSEHLVEENKEVRILKEFKPLNVDFFLYHHVQAFYPKLHAAVVKQLKI